MNARILSPLIFFALTASTYGCSSTAGPSTSHDIHSGAADSGRHGASDASTQSEDRKSIDNPPEIEVAGTWIVEDPIPGSANEGIQEQVVEISQEFWGAAPLMSYDNHKNTAVIMSPENDPFFAGLYHKIIWTEPVDGRFRHCQVAQGLESPEDAETAPDHSDPEDLLHGCGGHAWSALKYKSVSRP